MLNKSNKICCPLCNSENYKILYEVKSTDAASHFFLRNKELKDLLQLQIEELWGNESCYFLTCNDCSFCYAFPFIAGDDKYYSIAYSQSIYGSHWKFEFDYVFKNLNRLIELETLKKEFKILEIGAGNGTFISKVAKDLTGIKNVYCTEFSESSISTIKEQGITCYGIDIFGIKILLPGGKFDVICMFQVLEHLQDPNSVFKELNQLLRPNGFLYIVVPNALHRSFFDSLNYNEDLPPTHISRWNKNNLDSIGIRYGFKLLDFAIENSNYLSKFEKFFDVILKNRNINLIDNKIQRRFCKIVDFFVGIIKLVFYIKPLIELNNKNLGVSSIAVFISKKT